nr:DNA adenine methylase [Paracoccus sp. IB05]
MRTCKVAALVSREDVGGISLRRSMRPKAEVINDRSRDIANLFRILQRHYVQFLDVLKFGLTTRAEFERLVRVDPETLTDLERAARLLCLQRAAFGGKVSGRNFGVAKDRPARFNLSTLEPMLEDLHSRLAGVVIECLDWSVFIPRYDRPNTLFYVDPPYWGCEDDYGKQMFERVDFQRLADQLASMKGQFIRSLNDVPEVRAIFAAFRIDEVKTTCTINQRISSDEKAPELLIPNCQEVA